MQLLALEAVVDDDQLDVVGRVGRVRAAGGGVDHLLAVAVVGGDDRDAALPLDRVQDPADADVDVLDRLDRGGEHAGVADHVAVGEVHDEQVVAVRCRSRLTTSSQMPYALISGIWS